MGSHRPPRRHCPGCHSRPLCQGDLREENLLEPPPGAEGRAEGGGARAVRARRDTSRPAGRHSLWEGARCLPPLVFPSLMRDSTHGLWCLSWPCRLFFPVGCRDPAARPAPNPPGESKRVEWE